MELEGRQIRIGIVGAGCIGKSCIVKRYVENTFQGNPYNATLGVDFSSRRITVRPHGTATHIILDIGGLAMDSKMLDIYLKSGIDILLLTYDVTNMSSINDLRKWIEVIQVHQIDLSKLVLALVGSKADLEHLRTVRLDSHTRFKQEFDIPLSFIVSAKSGENVQTCFTTSTMYYINPDGRNRIREPGFAQTQLAKGLSVQPSLPYPPPAGPVPIPASAAKRQINQQFQQGTSASARHSASAAATNELNSTVCLIQ